MRKRWHAIEDRLDRDRDLVGVEVGVHKGGLSKKLLMRLPRLTLHMVDPWTVYTGSRRNDVGSMFLKFRQSDFEGFVAKAHAAVEEFGTRAIIHRAYSSEVAGVFDDAAFDFVYIDGDHTYEGCMADILAWLPKVKPGGWLMGHDYPKRSGVVKAVDEIFGKDFELDVGDTYYHKVNR